jgi:hypothetical protein
LPSYKPANRSRSDGYGYLDHRRILSLRNSALPRSPDKRIARFQAYWGAARAADGAGNRQKASDYFGKLVDLAKNADTARPEIREAKTFLARR